MKKYIWFVFAIAVLCLGILIGMTLQQAIIQSTLVKVASNMEGVEININLNETKLMEEARRMVNEDMITKEQGE